MAHVSADGSTATVKLKRFFRQLVAVWPESNSAFFLTEADVYVVPKRKLPKWHLELLRSPINDRTLKVGGTVLTSCHSTEADEPGFVMHFRRVFCMTYNADKRALLHFFEIQLLPDGAPASTSLRTSWQLEAGLMEHTTKYQDPNCKDSIGMSLHHHLCSSSRGVFLHLRYCQSYKETVLIYCTYDGNMYFKVISTDYLRDYQFFSKRSKLYYMQYIVKPFNYSLYSVATNNQIVMLVDYDQDKVSMKRMDLLTKGKRYRDFGFKWSDKEQLFMLVTIQSGGESNNYTTMVRCFHIKV